MIAPAYITIEHTGTQFFRYTLLNNYDGWCHPRACKPEHIAFLHCEERSHGWIDRAISGRTVLTTLRDPLHVVVSWYARRKLDWARLLTAYQIWESEVLPHADAILSLDHDRDARIMKARALLGIDTSVDWSTVVNTQRHNSLVHHYLKHGNLGELFSIIDGVSFKRFYRTFEHVFPPEYGWWK